MPHESLSPGKDVIGVARMVFAARSHAWQPFQAGAHGHAHMHHLISSPRCKSLQIESIRKRRIMTGSLPAQSPTAFFLKMLSEFI